MRKAAPPREIPPPLEMECLRALWKLGEGSVRDVRALVGERRPLAYTTVMTVMERLVRRGTVGRRKSGRAFLYAPVVERETLRQRAMSEFVETYFDGSESAMREWLRSATPRVAAAAEESPEGLDAALL